MLIRNDPDSDTTKTKIRRRGEAIRRAMMVVNTLGTATGIGILAFGTHLAVLYRQLSIFEPAVTLTAGSLVLFISVVGLAGFWRLNSGLVAAYSCLLGLGIGLQLATGIGVTIWKVELRDTVIGGMEATMRAWSAGNITDDLVIWNRFQRGGRCCGLDSYADWSRVRPTGVASRVPDSCCRDVRDPGCGWREGTVLFQDGCREKISRTFILALDTVRGVMCGVCLAELIGIIFATMYLRKLRETRKTVRSRSVRDYFHF